MSRHTAVATVPDDGTSEVGTNEWNAAHTTPVNSQSASYTLVASDAGKVIRVTAAATITVPNGVFSVGDDVAILAATASTVTVADNGTSTLVSRGSVFNLAGQWAIATVYCDASDHFVLSGDIT